MIARLPVSLQITATVIFVSLIVIVAAYVTQLWSLEQTLEASKRAKLENVSSIAKSLIEAERTRLRSIVVALRDHGELLAATRHAVKGDPASAGVVLDRLYRETGVSLLYLLGADGVVKYRAHLPERQGDLSTAWGVAEALGGETIVVASKGPLGLGIRAIAPVRDGERVIGAVMAGTIFDNAFAGRLASLMNADVAFASAESIWASSAPARHANFSEHAAAISESLYQRRAVFILDRQAALARQYTPMRIEHETFMLVLESDASGGLAQLRASQRQLLGAAGIALACAALLGAGIAVLMVRPLRQLRARAVSLVKDLAGEHIGSPAGNEVSSLVRAFDLAADALSRNASELRKARDAAEAAARHDLLTGLPNRAQLQQLLGQLLTLARRADSGVAILYLDLDNFKTINDTLGHEAGDEVLRQTADTLRRVVRDSDLVCRLGGDEFLVVLAGLHAAADAAPVAGKILHALAHSVSVRGTQLHVAASIGISVFPADGEDAEQLMRNADAAMYHAKDGWRGSFRYYTADMDARAQEAFALEGELRNALARDEFRLYYQPQFDIRSRRLIGAEALIRWQHPERGLVAPAAFVAVAEQRGLIVPIGDWVMEAACRQARAWVDAGLPAVRIAVNLSALQFRQDDLEMKVRRILAQTGLDPAMLELEITESTVLLGAESVKTRLQALRSIGLSLAIDDFGVGYSALGYLKRFPINRLKLDREFVRDVMHDPDDAAITRAIIAMGSQLRLEVVAEGVETAAQAQFLAENGCQAAQGNYFAPPLSAQEFATTLAATRVTVQDAA